MKTQEFVSCGKTCALMFAQEHKRQSVCKEERIKWRGLDGGERPSWNTGKDGGKKAFG